MALCRRIAALSCWVALSIPVSCGGAQIAEPDLQDHVADDYVAVEYPPPSALGEIIPQSPPAGAVWVDGHWSWRRGHWVWRRGGFVVPPEGARYADWELKYQRDGSLLFAEPRWFDSRGERIRRPRIVLPATTPPSPETSEKAAAVP